MNQESIQHQIDREHASAMAHLRAAQQHMDNIERLKKQTKKKETGIGAVEAARSLARRMKTVQ